jgi:hypothetical protein
MILLTLHEAARRIQGVPRTVSGRDSRKMPDVHRTHKALALAARAWDRTKGKQGLRTIVEGKRRRKVYLTDLNRWVMTRDENNAV